jgi:hypothetical protein
MNDAHQTGLFMLPFAGVFVIIGVVWLVGIASFVLGIAALISVARHPSEAFGPWWDNTRSTWLIGIAVSFVLPFGTLVTGIAWFKNGAMPLRRRIGPAGRPFWSGPAKPYPPYGAPGYPPPGYPPGYPPPAAPGFTPPPGPPPPGPPPPPPGTSPPPYGSQPPPYGPPQR